MTVGAFGLQLAPGPNEHGLCDAGPTRESTIHHQVTELGKTAQRLLKLTKMPTEKLGRVMGPDHGNKQAIREAPRPLGSPLAERVPEHVTMLGHVVENLQSIMARLDT